MINCDEILATLLLGRPLDASAEAHLAGCPRCAAEEVLVRRVSQALAADAVTEPPAALSARVLDAAAPLLGHNARRAAWPVLPRALAAALAPLPAILLLDVYFVRLAYGLLSSVLPSALSFYVVFNYVATLSLLLGLTYSAIPILAERQGRVRREEAHA